jgi:TolA-binding protein
MKRLIRLAADAGIALFLSSFLNACMSARDGEAMQQDLVDTKSKMLELQERLSQAAEKTETAGKASNLRIANSSSKLDQIEHEIQVVRGEVDTLRVRVETGRNPGAVENGEEDLPTSASDTASILERLAKLEEAQIEILEILEKGGKGPLKAGKAGKGTEKKSENLKNFSEFQKAFQGRKYSAITTSAGDALKKLKGDERREVAFMEAESLYRLDKLKDATLKFNKYIEVNKNGPRVDEAEMRMGDCFRRLGDKDTALIYYKELLEKHPDSSYADKAKERVQELEGKKSA